MSLRAPKAVLLSIVIAFSACLWTSAAPVSQPDVSVTSPPATNAAPLTEDKRLLDRADERVSLLSNGLRVLLKIHRTAPVASVRMYCQTGSIYEQEYLGSGMSHLFEHLLHGGATTTRSEEESRRILNEIGGNTNAFTSQDVTCFFINTGKEHTERALGLLGDWVTRPTFPDEAFIREWGVVQRELERDVDNPGTQLSYATMELMYRRHPASFPVIGYQPVVQTLTKKNIIDYYHRMYVPDNILVCIVGDIELDKMLSMVERNFAYFTRQRMPTIVLPEAPEIVTPVQAYKHMQVPAVLLNLAWPSIPLVHPDLYALDVLSFVLTQGDSSRLVRTIRDQGLVFSIDSSSWTPHWARGVFSIEARLAPQDLEKAKAAILEQIALVQREPITPEELAAAQRQKVAEHVLATQTAESVAEMMVSDFIATGDPDFSQTYVDRIQKVTAEQVRDVARKYLAPNRLATIAVVPEDYRPASEQLGAGAGPQPVRMIKLDNGVRCVIRTDPTTPIVAIQSFSLGGVLLENDKTNGLSRLAALLAPRGTQTRSAEDIARFFDSRGGSFDTESATNTIYFQAQVLKRDFAESLDVFADVVLHPAFPPAELETFRPRLIDAIQRVDESWRTELLAFLQKHLFEHSPYRFQAVGSRAVVAAATAAQVADFYHRCVTGPDTVASIFGDVNGAQAEAAARRLFGGLPDARLQLPAAEPEPTPAAPVAYVRVKPPTRDVAGVGLGFHGMKADDPDTVPTAVLQTIIAGYRYPTGWLEEALRGGNRSLVYEVHAQNIPGVLPGYFIVYAACQPDKVSDVYRIIMQQLERAKAGEITEDELQRAKGIIITSELLDNQTNSERGMQSSIDELYGLGYDYRDRLPGKVQAVTREDVKRMAVKYFTVPVVAVVTPAPDKVDLGIRTVRVPDEPVK